MAGIEEAFEKFVKKISDIEGKDTEDNSNVEFGKNVYAPQDGLFFSPVQKNQIPFGDILKSDQRLNPPMPTPMQRNLSSEERMRLEDNEYFMSQGQPQYVSPVVQGQGFNKRDLKDFTKQYLQSQTPLGGGIGYQGPEYGVVAIKPFVGPDRSALLQGYYNTDNEGSRIQAMLSPKEQQIGYTGNTGTTFSAGRNTFQGSPYYTLNLSKSFADGGVASMFRERSEYAEGGDIRNIIKQFEEKGITPSSFAGPNGIKFELVTGRFSGTPRYTPIYPEGYDFSKFGAIGGGYTEFEPEDFFKSVMAPEGTYFDYEKNDFLPMVSTPEIPTVDPFSGQQVSAQDQAAFTTTSGINFQSTSPVEPEITNPILTQPQLPVSNNPALTNLGAFFGIKIEYYMPFLLWLLALCVFNMFLNQQHVNIYLEK